MPAAPDNQALLAVAVEAARAAGGHALRHRARRTEVARQSPHDVKLRLDLECQAVAEARIHAAFPGHAILGEEGRRPRPGAAAEWIVDPIDGTVNFFHGLPLWCCSVAVRAGGQTRAGCVYAPALDQLYTATRDGPACGNGNPLRVSETDALSEAMVATGAVSHVDDERRSIGVFEMLVPRVQKVRVMGAAALDLCHVAAGRIEAYVEMAIFPWDIAAGRLLVERAGGRVLVMRRWGGRRLAVLASNRRLHAAFRECLLPYARGGARRGVAPDAGA